jgi:hypothetical protein
MVELVLPDELEAWLERKAHVMRTDLPGAVRYVLHEAMEAELHGWRSHEPSPMNPNDPRADLAG